MGRLWRAKILFAVLAAIAILTTWMSHQQLDTNSLNLHNQWIAGGDVDIPNNHETRDGHAVSTPRGTKREVPFLSATSEPSMHPLIASIVGSNHEKNQKKDTVHFNYTLFWQQAWEDARRSQENLGPLSSRLSESCPKVFVYNLTAPLRDEGAKYTTIEQVFGKSNPSVLQGHLHNTNQYALASILEYRLHLSRNCRTDDPSEADLFWVPILIAPKTAGQWKSACRRQLTESLLLPQLVHLNDQTACRHFFVLSKGHYNGKTCTGWWKDPVPRLQHSLRVAYSHVDFIKMNDDNNSKLYAVPGDDVQLEREYPHLFSVPYPSSLHWTRNNTTTPPWENDSSSLQQRQKYLMMFLGSTKVHGDKPLRRKLLYKCGAYNANELCKVKAYKGNPSMMAKTGSIFCLEPVGDSPWRKSLADDISLGCIPVLFSNLTDRVADWHWGSRKRQARVLVDRERFLQSTIDLFTLLSTIPPALLDLMHATIRHYGRGFQYSIDDDPNDGIRIMLEGLKMEAESLVQQGLCGS